MDEKMNRTIDKDNFGSENVNQPIICSNCGEQFSTSIMYCPNCGTRQGVQMDDLEKTSSNQRDQVAPKLKFTKKKKKIAIIGGSVAVVAIILTIILIIMFFGGLNIASEYKQIDGKGVYTFNTDNNKYEYITNDEDLKGESGTFSVNDKEGYIALESDHGKATTLYVNGDYIYSTPYIGDAKLKVSDFDVYSRSPSTFKNHSCDFSNAFYFSEDGTYIYTYTIDYTDYYLDDIQLLKTYGTYTIDKDTGLVKMNESSDGHKLYGMIKNGTFYGKIYKKND